LNLKNFSVGIPRTPIKHGKGRGVKGLRKGERRGRERGRVREEERKGRKRKKC
jgi:hypothetical protein